MTRRVLIAGISTRAAAESAARAGFDVTAIDGFADLDQQAGVRAVSLPRDCGHRFTAAAAARIARSHTCDAVVYVSGFENHPSAVATLAAGRMLWGNSPDVLRRVRDPRCVADALQRRRLPALAISLDAPAASGAHAWLCKPLASGGGHRIRPWRQGARVPRSTYLQERAVGTVGSIVFVAARGRVVPLAMTRQLIGDARFGSRSFRYCGSVLAAGFSRLVSSAAVVLAEAIAGEFGLRGVNGIDFVERDGVPYLLEVNPRWSASMELVERATGLCVFAAHAAACTDGSLPDQALAVLPGEPLAVLPGEPLATGVIGEAMGKAIVFARRDVVIGDTREWLSDSTLRDIPWPGDRIATGHPVCTVFARGEDDRACVEALARRADRVYEALDAWAREGDADAVRTSVVV
jgi:uncharacterized protein